MYQKVFEFFQKFYKFMEFLNFLKLKIESENKKIATNNSNNDGKINDNIWSLKGLPTLRFHVQ